MTVSTTKKRIIDIASQFAETPIGDLKTALAVVEGAIKKTDSNVIFLNKF